MPHEALLNRVRAEFLEMPGLCLTLEQAQRLYGMNQTVCQRVLDKLIDTRFLCVRSNGMYARLSDGTDLSRLRRPAKADLRTGTSPLKAAS